MQFGVYTNTTSKPSYKNQTVKEEQIITPLHIPKKKFNINSDVMPCHGKTWEKL